MFLKLLKFIFDGLLVLLISVPWWVVDDNVFKSLFLADKQVFSVIGDVCDALYLVPGVSEQVHELLRLLSFEYELIKLVRTILEKFSNHLLEKLFLQIYETFSVEVLLLASEKVVLLFPHV